VKRIAATGNSATMMASSTKHNKKNAHFQSLDLAMSPPTVLPGGTGAH